MIGCDIVRFAVPDMESAAGLNAISEKTSMPLVADIHFDYTLALECLKANIAAIRINPGNISDENKIKEISDMDAPRIITPENLAELVDMIAANEINGKQAKDIFIKMLDGERGTIHEIADKYGMKQITDTGAIESAVDEVIKNNPAQVEQYKSGKVGLLGFFVGNVMKATKGQVNPAMVSDLLKKKLG